jgi:hypothetical protein
VSRATRSSYDYFHTPLMRIFCEFHKPLRGAVCGNNGNFKGDSHFFEEFRGSIHDGQIGIRSHDDTD